jgi:hypothetical protein
MDGTLLKYWGGDILDDTLYIYIYILGWRQTESTQANHG